MPRKNTKTASASTAPVAPVVDTAQAVQAVQAVPATPAPATPSRGRPSASENRAPSAKMTVKFDEETTSNLRACVEVLRSDARLAPMVAMLNSDAAVARLVISMGLTAFHKTYGASE